MFVHGQGSVVTIDGKTIGTYATAATFTRTTECVDVTPVGARSRTYKPGLTGGTAKVSGLYDNTASTGPRSVLRPLLGGAPVDLVYRLSVSVPTATVSVRVSSYEETGAVADMVAWECELQFADTVRIGPAYTDIYTSIYTRSYGEH